MSWAEVKKINSNFINEPLDFLNYIYDISVFGAESYVMDKSNEGLWRQLITNSLTMFGHDAIHEYIYNRLTDEDVDYMLTNNARLGQSFNSFYNTDVFPAGTIDDVLKTLTAETYNILELKIQQGINRYIESFMGLETGVGTWLNSLFALDNADLVSCQSLNDIVSSTSLLESLLASEPVCMVLVNNAALYKIQLEDSLFNQLITYIASSTTATTALIVSSIAGNTWGGVLANEEAVKIIAGKEESVRAIIYNADAFAALLENTSALETVISNDAGRTAIIKAIEYYANASNVIQAVKDDLGSIKNNMPLIGSELSLEKIDKCIDVINSTVQVLDKTASCSDIIISNIKAMLDNIKTMGVLFRNDAAVSAIFGNPDIRPLIASKIQSGNRDFIILLYNSSPAINYMQSHATVLYSNANINSAERSATIPGVTYITDYNGTFYGTINKYETRYYYSADGVYHNKIEYVKAVKVFGVGYHAYIQALEGGSYNHTGFYVYGFKF